MSRAVYQVLRDLFLIGMRQEDPKHDYILSPITCRARETEGFVNGHLLPQTSAVCDLPELRVVTTVTGILHPPTIAKVSQTSSLPPSQGTACRATSR